LLEDSFNKQETKGKTISNAYKTWDIAGGGGFV
jgi:hypothetical protein